MPRIWTPAMEYVWEKASYTVPGNITEERVQDTGAKYRNKFGKVLEAKGFTVLRMDGPYLDTTIATVGVTDPDRRKYVIWAKVTRRPQTCTVDVPDEDVVLYAANGFKLVS